ncbi:hypothetical protein [Sphingobacterium thalpophilum]|uniref:hypothetical protein n=1 Tax=Sphingobacterium thalpophilum TaxID=259 RepID=UPI0031D3840C
MKRNLLVFRILLCLLYYLNIIPLYGQLFDGSRIVKPGLTPEAFSLFKSVDYPMEFSKGLPNIATPVFTFQLNNFSYPISISYNASGIKVAEIASSVGLGWSLNAGGCISSMINGLDDLGVNGRYNYTPAYPENRPLKPELLHLGGGEYVGNDDYKWCMQVSGNPIIRFENESTSSPVLDTEPDIFYFSAGELSGKFFFGQDKKAYTIPFRKVKIDYEAGKFKITDEKGTQYIFDIIEQSTTYSNESSNNTKFITNSEPIVSKSYYLSSIITIENERLDFEYINLSFKYENQQQFSRFKALSNNLDEWSKDAETSVKSFVDVEGKFISKIKSSRGEVVNFIYADCSRKDLHSGLFDQKFYTGGKSLKQIKISNDGISKTFDLYQSYFSTGAIVKECSSENIDPNNLKLRLDSMGFTNESKFKFDYFSNLISNRTYGGIDHWGYPSTSPGRYSYDVDYGFTTNSGERKSSLELTRNTNLRKIIYPTGGSDVFDYELNSYCDTIAGGYVDSLVSRTVQYYYQEGDGRRVIPFTVKNIDVISSYIKFNSTVAPAQPNLQFNIMVKNSTGKYYYYESISGPTTVNFNLPTGDYELIVDQIGIFDEGYIILGWNEKEQVHKPTTISNKDVGGLRLKRINKYSDNELKLESTRRFEYFQTNNRDFSSGHLYYKPRYSYSMRKTTRYLHPTNPDQNVEIDAPYLAQNSSSITHLFGYGGSHILYTDVREYFDEFGYCGYSDYKYSFSEDLRLFDPSSFTPPTSYEFRRGLLLSKNTYRIQLSTPELISSTQNFYNFNYTGPSGNSTEFGEHFTDAAKPNEKHALGLKVKLIFPEFQSKLSWIRQSAGFEISSYKLISNWVYLDSSVTTTYAGNEPIVSSQKFKYLNPLHAQLSLIKRNNSKNGSTVYTRFSYPQDYLSGTPFIDLLKNKFVIDRKIESVNYILNNDKYSIIDANIDMTRDDNLFFYKKLTLDIKEPISLSTFRFSAGSMNEQNTTISPYSPDSRYEVTHCISRHDAIGNPVEVQELLMPLTIFIWGYSGQYPIMEIKNATYAQVETVLTKAAIDNLNVSTHSEATMETLIKNAADKLRAGLPNAMVTSYTYKPLVGMTSRTDPRGITEYYKYDGMQRLQAILDHLNHVNRAFDYHYRPN